MASDRRTARRAYAVAASVYAAGMVFMLAVNAGIPVWKSGWVLPGDATDLAVVTGFGFLFLLEWAHHSRGEINEQ